MRDISFVCIPLLNLKSSVLYPIDSNYNIGTMRHLRKQVSLGNMNVSTVVLESCIPRGRICIISSSLTCQKRTSENSPRNRRNGVSQQKVKKSNNKLILILRMPSKSIQMPELQIRRFRTVKY